MFTTSKMIAAASLIALTLGSADVSAQQMTGSAKSKAYPNPSADRGSISPSGRILSDSIVPGAPFILFIGDSKGSPVLLLDSGIVPQMGKLTLKMGVSLQHDSIESRTWFQSGTTVVCVTAPERGELSVQTTNQGVAMLVQDSVSFGSQGLGLSGQGKFKGSPGDKNTNSRRRARPAHKQGQAR